MLGIGTARRAIGAVGRGMMAVGGTVLAQPQQWFRAWSQGNAGGNDPYMVNETTALNYLAVYNCVSLISSTIAALPLVTYRRSGNKIERATKRPEYRILQSEFNPETAAMIGREAGMGHLLTWGNSFTQIVKNKSGSTLLGLQPLGPDVVKVVRNARKQLGYEVRQRGTSEVLATLRPEEVLHVPGLGFDGIVGYSPIRIARSAIRAGLSQDLEAEKYITRGIRPPGVIKFPAGKKFKDAQDGLNFRNKFEQIHVNKDSALNVMILEDGSDWQSIGIDPVSAQLLESRKFSRKEICGLYRVPPHMVGDVESSTSWGSGIGEQKDGFVTFTLLTWIKRVEQEYNRKLFGGDDDGEEYYCEHLVEGLLRGDVLKRSQALQIQHMRGAITDNEWRALENRNPVEGGDVRHFPLAEGRIDLEGNVLPNPNGANPLTPSPGRQLPAKPGGIESPAEDKTDPTKPTEFPVDPNKKPQPQPEED
jgi:HK97 family phage portal protein